MKGSGTPTPPATALPELTRVNRFFKDSLWKCTFAGGEHRQKGMDLCLLTGDGPSWLERSQTPSGNKLPSLRLPCASWHEPPHTHIHRQNVFWLLWLLTNDLRHMCRQEQTQNNAHGMAPPDAFQPKIASQQLTGSSGHLLHLQLGGTRHDFWEESLLRQDPFHLSLDTYCLQRSELARVPFRGKQALPEGMSSHPGLDEGQTKQPGKNSCFHWLKKGSQLPALR